MPDERTADPMRSVNTSLTSPEQDLKNPGTGDPSGVHGERVPVDSGGTHAAPGYGGAPGHRIDPNVDPAAPTAAAGSNPDQLPAAVGPAATDLDEGANPDGGRGRSANLRSQNSGGN